MNEEEKQQLIADHFLFVKPDSALMSGSGMDRDWPDARGIFHNEAKNFLLWVSTDKCLVRYLNYILVHVQMCTHVDFYVV